MDLAETLFGDDASLELPPLPLPGTDDVAMAEPAVTGAIDGAVEKMPVDEDDDEEDGGGLFGDDSDDGEDKPTSDVHAANEADDDDLSDTEAARRAELEYGEQSDPSKLVTKELTLAQIELANFGIPPAPKVWLARLPNFLALNSDPFDELMWEPEEEKEDEDEEAGAGKTQILDENVIRWRWTIDENGQPVKESNSRIVRWSDGSLSLQVGSELFDISASVDHSSIPDASSSTTAVSSSKPPSTDLASFDPNRSHSLTYVTATHSYSALIEAQASVHGTLSFRPSTLQSNTHRKLAGRIKVKNAKERVMKVADLPAEDPEKKKLEREKAELDKAKKLKRELQKGARGANRGKGRQKRETRFSDGEDHDGEDQGGDSDDDMRGPSQMSSRQQSSRRGRDSMLAQDEGDEDDDGFVVDDDDEGAKDKDDEESEAEASDSEEEENKDDAEGRMAPRRRLVVEDDEDE